MSDARNLIRTNVSPQSDIMITRDYTKSPFLNRAWHTSVNYSTQKLELSPVNPQNDAINSSANFRFVKNADFYGFIVIQIPFTAVSGGAGFSYRRLVDFVTQHVINRITVMHTSNTIQTVDGQVLNLQYRKDSTFTRRSNVDKRLLGNLSPTLRNAFAKDVQVGWVDLDNVLWFCYSTNYFLPVMTLSSEIDFTVYFNSAARIIQCDHTSGTPTVGISSVAVKGIQYPLSLICSLNHVTGFEREFHTGLYEKKGLAIAHTNFKQQPRYTVNSGTSGVVNVRLTSIKDPITEFYWAIRLMDDVTGDYSQEPNRLLSYVGMSFTGNAGELIPFTSKNWIDTRLREMFHSSIVEDEENIGFYSFSWIPEDHVNNNGTVHFANIADPTLNIFLGTNKGDSDAYDALNGTGIYGPSGKSIVIDVWFNTTNFIHQKGGDIRLVFA